MWLLSYEDSDDDLFELLFHTHRQLWEYARDNKLEQYEARFIGVISAMIEHEEGDE